jgi:hypothetical protein
MFASHTSTAELPRLDFAILPQVWRRTVLTVFAKSPLGLAHLYSLPHRIRGAFGHALMRAEGDEATQALELLFGETHEWRPGAQLPRPFLIECDQQPGMLELRLVLFGVAGRWRDVAFDAFVSGLESGIAIDERPGAARRPFVVEAAEWSRTEAIDVPSGGMALRLSFRTPLQLGPRHTLGMRYPDIIVSAAERAAGLAIWQGFRVEPELGRWRDIAKQLSFNDEGLRPVTWERRSGAQGGRLIGMAGLVGHLDIIRPPESILPLLALGETMHVGGGSALGLGRYDLL